MNTENNDYDFAIVDDGPVVRLAALGVGGMGNNAMENLARSAVRGLELYSFNTDVQALRRCQGSKPVQLGAKRTGGKGAGGNSDIGRMSAEDDSEKIRRVVAGAEMAFIVSGMGGGTGSGAAPVIARICRELGVLTVCIVTMPMECEGGRRREKAIISLNELRKSVDSLLIIENEKLSTVMDQEDVSIIEVFRKADKVVVDSVTGIARIINSHGYINLDLADLKNVLKRGVSGDCVDAYIGFGEASGPDRARKASEIALNNPLLRTINIHGAANLLVNVAGSEHIGHKEAMSAVKNVVEQVGSDNHEIFMGVVTDNNMGDSISITVIATGLPLRGSSVVNIKSNCIETKDFHDHCDEGGELVDIQICQSNISENRISELEYRAVEINCLPDVSGFSPLVRKKEWQTPAYLRQKDKLSEIGQVQNPRVRKIKDRRESSNVQLSHTIKNTHPETLRYHMVG